MRTRYWVAALLAATLGAGVASAHQFGHMRPSFGVLDANSDGVITQEEMQTQKTAQFNRIDSNGDGMLSAEEMLARGKVRASERMAKRIGMMIEKRDVNKDGMLSLTEMGPRPRANILFQRLDSDGDGVLSAEEYAMRQGTRWGLHNGKMVIE